MDIIKTTFILCYVFMCLSLEIKPDFRERNQEMCTKIAKDPYFDIDIVVGKPWRVYYTWNMKFENKCFDMVFQNATRKTIEKIRTDITDYLEQQPYWETATLHLSTIVRSTKHEVLLFADQGPAGSFLAVPNMAHETNFTPMRNSVPLLKFMMKLIRNGKYLLVMDCHMGGASLSARPDHQPYRVEIASEVASLNLGDGFPACTSEKHKDEQFFV